MARDISRKNVQQTSQVWSLIFLTMCFTLCGAGACTPMSLGGGDPKKWTEMVTAGNEAMKTGDYATAEKMFTGAETACAKDFGKEDARRATCLGYLAEMYRAQQEYRKAALVYKELIDIKEKTDPKSQELTNFREQYAEIQKKIKEYGLDKDNSPGSSAPKGTEPKKDAHPAPKKGKKAH